MKKGLLTFLFINIFFSLTYAQGEYSGQQCVQNCQLQFQGEVNEAVYNYRQQDLACILNAAQWITDQWSSLFDTLESGETEDAFETLFEQGEVFEQIEAAYGCLDAAQYTFENSVDASSAGFFACASACNVVLQ